MKIKFRAREKTTSHFAPPIHPARLRYSSSNWPCQSFVVVPCRTGASTPQIWELILTRTLITGVGMGLIFLFLGCNGTTPVAETISDSRPDDKIEKTDLREGPSGELLSGLAALPPVGEADKAPDGILEQEATGRNDLLDAARKAISQNRAQDAVAISDVLVLLNPGDMEVLELRGRALIAQGNEEDGRTDLETCCAAGRKSCCP